MDRKLATKTKTKTKSPQRTSAKKGAGTKRTKTSSSHASSSSPGTKRRALTLFAGCATAVVVYIASCGTHLAGQLSGNVACAPVYESIRNSERIPSEFSSPAEAELFDGCLAAACQSAFANHDVESLPTELVIDCTARLGGVGVAVGGSSTTINAGSKLKLSDAASLADTSTVATPASNGLVVVNQPLDGRCLYHSLGAGMDDARGIDMDWRAVRGMCMSTIQNNPAVYDGGILAWREENLGVLVGMNFPSHLLGDDADPVELMHGYVEVMSSDALSGPLVFGGDPELQAMANTFNIKIDVHQYQKNSATITRIRPSSVGSSSNEHVPDMEVLLPEPLPDLDDNNIIRIKLDPGTPHYDYLRPFDSSVDLPSLSSSFGTSLDSSFDSSLDSSIDSSVASPLHSSAGVAVHNRMVSSDFHKVYFDQEHAMTDIEFVDDVAPTFTPGILNYAVEGKINGVSTPIHAIQAEQLRDESFFLDDSKVSGAYLSCVYVSYDEAMYFLNGGMDDDLAGGQYDLKGANGYRMGPIKTALKAATSSVRSHCDRTRCDPSRLQVMLPYVGLTAKQVVKNPDDPKHSRMDQHVTGGMKVSLHSAFISFIFDSGIFKSSRHEYGAIAISPYGNKQLAAAQEVFGTGAILHHGDSLDYRTGALNVAPTGILSIDDGDEGMLYVECWDRSVRYGSQTQIDAVEIIGPTLRAIVLRSPKIRAKIVKFGGPQYESRPETATLAILQRAISGVAGDASWTDEVRAKREKKIASHPKVASTNIRYKEVSTIHQARGLAGKQSQLQTIAKHEQVESKKIPGKKVSKHLQAAGVAAHSAAAEAKWAASMAKTMEKRAETFADPDHPLKPTLLEAIRSNTRCPRKERSKRDCIHCTVTGRKYGGKVPRVGSAGTKYSLCRSCTDTAKKLINANNFDDVEW